MTLKQRLTVGFVMAVGFAWWALCFVLGVAVLRWLWSQA
jgi:hypothetical protein